MAWIVLALLAVFAFVVVPRLALVLAGAPRPARVPWLPWVAAALFVAAWFLPNPALEQTATFTQHAVGGGAACAVMTFYVALNAGVRRAWVRVALAYAVTAALGTGAELVELAYDEAYDAGLTADTSWDLFANSTGALVTAVALEAGLVLSGGRTTARRGRRPRR